MALIRPIGGAQKVLFPTDTIFGFDGSVVNDALSSGVYTHSFTSTSYFLMVAVNGEYTSMKTSGNIGWGEVNESGVITWHGDTVVNADNAIASDTVFVIFKGTLTGSQTFTFT